jgi:pimeloyl-ACP methyl ester carboxylesterase
MGIVKVLLIVLLLAGGCGRANLAGPNLESALGARKTFNYQGLKINYYEKGQGKPVILLHGFGASAYSWRFLAPALARDHRVFTIDLKGFGLSDKPADDRYAIDDQAEIIAQFIRSQNLADAVLVGNSMGGGVALLTYFKFTGEAGRIKSLVLIDSAGYDQKLPWFIALLRVPGLAQISTGVVPPRTISHLVLKKCVYDQAKISEEMIDTYAYYLSLAGAREALIQTAQKVIPADLAEVSARFKTIAVPVLVLWGAEDHVVPLEVGRYFKRDIPDSRLVIFPRCGHIPQEEEPGGTIKIVADFLEKQR